MKKRNPHLTHPCRPKLVREWDDASGWAYCLWQTPAGSYIVTGSDGEDWCEESGATVKAALIAAHASPDEAETLLTLAE